MTWHVIKKDLRCLWWLVPVLVLSAAGYLYSDIYRFSHFGPGWRKPLIVILPYVAVILAVGRAVQTDFPITKLADWHTRPISRWSYLSAKALIALFGVLLPWCAIDFGWALHWGLDIGGALSGVLVHGVFLAGMLLTVIAAAAAFRTTIQYLLVLGGVALSLIVITLAAPLFFRWLAPSWPVVADASGDATGNFFTALIGLGLAASLAVLYRRRNIGVARLILVVAVIGGLMVWRAAAYIESRTWSAASRPEPAAAQGLTLQFDPAQPKAPGMVIRRLGLTLYNLSVPVRVTNPSGVNLKAERILVTQTGSEGTRHFLYAKRGLDRLVLGPVGPFDLNPARLEVAYRIELSEPLATTALSASGQTVQVPGLGVCRAGPAAADSEAMVMRCLSGKPLACPVIELAGRPLGGGCTSSTRLMTGFNQVTVPIPGSQVPLSVTTYRKLGVVDRRFSTPPIKLLDLVRQSEQMGQRSGPPSPAVNAE